MIPLAAHLMIVPILLPLVAGAAMLLLDDRRRALKGTISLLSIFALLVVAVVLLLRADGGAAGVQVGVYRLGGWPAPFGIVLVVDRLSALMLVLGSVLAFAAMIFSLARWHRVGTHFHSLFQFLLVGLNGAFLTGDLFNLFVFVEVLLAASYGLALHGSGVARVKAGLHYIAVNLTASMLFLIGVALIYGVTGTLNMADLATRVAHVTGSDRTLLQAGAGVLGVAFLIKAGMWPLSFWLPRTYAAAAPPVAAMFAIMTKVGVYIVLRLWLLLGSESGSVLAHFGGAWLSWGGMATIAFGAIGMLAAQNLGRMAGFAVLISSGTMLAAIGTGRADVTASALFYLLSSTVAISAFFMLIELVERDREPGADVLAVTTEVFVAEEGEPDLDEPQEVGIAIPATMVLLGLGFLGCALVLAGLPPLSGFVAKFALLSALLGAPATNAAVGIGAVSWVLFALLVGSGFTTLIAMVRAGIRVFWASAERPVPRVRVIEMLPVVALLLACGSLTVLAGPAMEYLNSTAHDVHAPQAYVRSVLAPVRGVGT